LLNFAALFIAGIMAVGAIFGAINTMYAAVGARAPEIAVLLTLVGLDTITAISGAATA
jgi:ABC-type antimicrobial peptide transport system permease subunit